MYLSILIKSAYWSNNKLKTLTNWNFFISPHHIQTWLNKQWNVEHFCCVMGSTQHAVNSEGATCGLWISKAFIPPLRTEDHPSSWHPVIVRNTCGGRGGSSRCHKSQMHVAWLWILQTVASATALVGDACRNENRVCNLHHTWLDV